MGLWLFCLVSSLLVKIPGIFLSFVLAQGESKPDLPAEQCYSQENPTYPCPPASWVLHFLRWINIDSHPPLYTPSKAPDFLLLASSLAFGIDLPLV